jgi:hypothetical protein
MHVSWEEEDTGMSCISTRDICAYNRERERVCVCVCVCVCVWVPKP